MNTSFIKGIIPPIVTPITEDERIDEDRLRQQLEFMIEGGIHGVLAFGTNGEFYAVDEPEALRGLRILLDQANGRIPVFMGLGSISTRKCVASAKAAAEAGADAISVLQPMFIKPNEDELFTHFKTVAESVPSVPVLLYNNPARIGYSISPELAVRLGESVSNIVGIKDSSGDMTLTAEFIRRTRGSNFRVLGGKDTLCFGTLVHGGHGSVATVANFAPKMMCSIYEKFVEGDLAGALDAQYALNPVRLTIDKTTFPVGTKDILRLTGRDMGKPYLPVKLTQKEDVLNLMREELRCADLL